MRAGTSQTEFACRVPAPPSWPVLSAASKSTTSAPRISPTTMRSGRMRSDCCRSRAIVISPRPSALARRATSVTTCGCKGASSAVSSITRMRSESGTVPSIAESKVVLPAPVPPMTRKEAWRSTIARSRGSTSAAMLPLATSWSRLVCAWRSTRKLMQVPPAEGGASSACRRRAVPSGRASLPSAKGCASSRRTPATDARRVASWRTSASLAKLTGTGSKPLPRSMKQLRGPLTTTSLSPGCARIGSSTPSPSESWRRRRKGREHHHH